MPIHKNLYDRFSKFVANFLASELVGRQASLDYL